MALPRAGEHDLTRIGLIVVLATTFALRLWGIKQGLPYSYNVDEATHFVPRAIAFFSHDFNPHYFLNPPAYSYLLHVIFEVWFGSADAVSRGYAADPTAIYVVARVVAALLGTIAVWLTYLTGARLISREVGLLAAAIFGLAFLPIFYSHLALNDVPTLAPVALSLYGVVGVLRFGRRRDYLFAGVGIGLAAATKYTGGITIVCLVAAFTWQARGPERALAARRFGAGLAAALAAFLLANPYAILDFHTFWTGVSSQASLSAGAEPVKLGTPATSGIAYYLWTFTWGLGWGPTLAAIGGAVLLLARRQIALASVLLPAPIVFIIVMGTQQRFFGRWLMPIFQIVSIVAAYGAVADARWLASARRLPFGAGLGLAAVLLLTQSLVSVLHNDAVLSRPDTRTLARTWMQRNVPAGAKVVIEPVVSDNWTTDVGVSLPWTPSGDRWYRYPTWLTDVDSRGRLLPGGRRRYVVVDQYERTLRPGLLNDYVSSGYCWLVIGSLQAGRAFAQPGEAPAAVAYYRALRKQATLRYHVSPFSGGAHPVPFSFDWSIDYLPRQYHLPGPEMAVYRLRGGKCT
ncbi:MAG: glycosyltransferase family 39 protein [Solirubrobacterales bacterium]|nr:glycosyltransferase family 39 protein [Solirubrobacterales bacterium]